MQAYMRSILYFDSLKDGIHVVPYAEGNDSGPSPNGILGSALPFVLLTMEHRL